MMCNSAADEIDRLRAELDAANEQLANIHEQVKHQESRERIAEKMLALRGLGCIFSAANVHPAAVALSINQCDGCMAGQRVDEFGHHYDERSRVTMACQAHKYAATPAPVAQKAHGVMLNSYIVKLLRDKKQSVDRDEVADYVALLEAEVYAMLAAAQSQEGKP